MRQEPTTWYMDNNNYLTKDFVDTFIDNFLKSVVPGDENKTVENIKEHYDCANPAAPLTCARDFGLFRNDEMGDSTKLYNNQTLSFAELVFELIFKRNAYKDTESNIKPAVLICKYFDILNNIDGIDDERKILTSTECYHFLCGVDDYEEIDEEYVRYIIDERKFSPHNPELPIIERVPNNVYITSLFYSLCDTGLFVYGKKKGIIKPTDISRDLIHYISINGPKMSSAPIKIGGNSNNVYEYLCDINNGILEIVPEIKLKSELDAQDVRGAFEYLFGIGTRNSFNWEKYFSTNVFAVYKPFFIIKNIAITKIYLNNATSGELLFDYAKLSNYQVLIKENKVMIMPFSETEHTPIEKLQIENDKFQGEMLNHNFFGMHIKNSNNCLDADNPHVCIGWSILGDLTGVTSKSQIEELYDKHLPDKSPNSRGQDIGQICRFRFDMHNGDYVVYGDGSVGHIGVIKSDYYYEQQDGHTQSADYINNRKVLWLKSVPYTAMPQNLRNAVGSSMSIFSLNEYKKEILVLLDETSENYGNTHTIINDEKSTNYSIEELGVLLKQMYDASKETGQVASIHMFGFKYGKQITENSYSINKIVAASGLPASYTAEVNKGVNIFKSTLWNEYGIRFYNNQEDLQEKDNNANILPDREPRKNQLHCLNSILYGAPGTGKTYSTAEYALAIIENRAIDSKQKTDSERKEVMSKYKEYVKKGQIVFTTFHQSYGYEDFIQGLRPNNSGNALSFKTVDGVFKKISDIAIADKENNYVIVIDEINRANISKVFGELITLIETDKRWGEINEISVTLPSGDPFAVPNNLYIVGTMNSADKSISLIDAALRRRFNFVEKTPDSSLITDVKLKKVLDTLNAGLANELDSTDLLIGHAYFIGQTIDDLAAVMNSSIIPLLYEYFYDNKDKVKAQIAEAIKDLDYEIHGGKIGRINIVKKG